MRPSAARALRRAASLGALGAAAALSFGAARACLCASASPFLALVGAAELVVVGRVAAHVPGAEGRPAAAVDVVVGEVLGGPAPAPGPLRVRDLRGDGCRPAAAALPVGTRWVLALSLRRVERGRREYALHGCGPYYVRVEGQRAIGPISDDRERSLPLAELRRLVRERLRPAPAAPGARGAVGTAAPSSPRRP